MSATSLQGPAQDATHGGVPVGYDLLGVTVHAVTLDGLCRAVEEAVESKSRRVIANHNLNSVYLYHRDAGLRAFYARASLTFIDGMPLVPWGCALGFPLRREHRLTAVDWLRPLLRFGAHRKWRVFFLGGKPGVADRAAARLRDEIPGLEIHSAHGFFDATPGGAASSAILARIREVQPHVLIVGMGMPRQEHWIVGELDRIAANVILNQGAFLDYVAGECLTPPRWAAALGLEWLARLAADPRRLWRRYLVHPWALLPCFVQDWKRRRSSAPAARQLLDSAAERSARQGSTKREQMP
jgi:N-acetylglucosaminyldiphosphoundecaprenol N-acetyl-beta-D-mannosaminyltransferase